MCKVIKSDFRLIKIIGNSITITIQYVKHPKKEYLPIFVGSTFSDLQEHRKSVRAILHKMKTIVNGMEYFGSKPCSPLEEC